MTFVVVGGGPTGVELAGAIAEIAVHTLRHDFRHINPEDARILLVEAAPHVLAHYPESLCERAAKKIRALGIEVLTQHQGHGDQRGLRRARAVLRVSRPSLPKPYFGVPASRPIHSVANSPPGSGSRPIAAVASQ